MTKYIYIVTSGHYDSYAISAVFTKLYHAQEYVKAYGGDGYSDSMRIEKHVTDHAVEHTGNGVLVYRVSVTKDATSADARKWDYDFTLKTPRHTLILGGKLSGGADVYVMAKSEKEAITKAINYFKKHVKP